MQPTQISQADRSPDVEPAIRHVVPWRVASVSTMPDLLLRVVFVDGTTGDVCPGRSSTCRARALRCVCGLLAGGGKGISRESPGDPP